MKHLYFSCTVKSIIHNSLCFHVCVSCVTSCFDWGILSCYSQGAKHNRLASTVTPKTRNGKYHRFRSSSLLSFYYLFKEYCSSYGALKKKTKKLQMKTWTIHPFCYNFQGSTHAGSRLGRVFQKIFKGRHLGAIEIKCPNHLG